MRNATPGLGKSCNAKDHDTHKRHTTKSSTSSFLTSFVARIHRLDASVRASIALTNEVTDRQSAIKLSIATGGRRISDLENGLRTIITDYGGAAKSIYESRVALNEHSGAIDELGTRLAQLSVQEIYDTVDRAPESPPEESPPSGDGQATDHVHLEEQSRALHRHRIHASDEQLALYSRLARSEGQAEQGFVELEAAMDTWLARWRKEAAEAREIQKRAQEREEREEVEEEREWLERTQRDRQDKEVLEMIAAEMAREREAWAQARADAERETAQMALEADEMEKRMNARPERKEEETRDEQREAKEEAKEMDAKWKAKEEARKQDEKAKEEERKKEGERKKEEARRTEIREALQKAEERKKEEERQKEEEHKKEEELKKEEERKKEEEERRKKEKAAKKENVKAKLEKNAEKEREKRARRERERKDLSPESRARYDEQAVLIDRYDAAKEKEEAEQRAFAAGVPPLTPPTTPMPTPADQRDVPNVAPRGPPFVPPASSTPTQPAPARQQPQRAPSTTVPPASSTHAQPAVTPSPVSHPSPADPGSAPNTGNPESSTGIYTPDHPILQRRARRGREGGWSRGNSPWPINVELTPGTEPIYHGEGLQAEAETVTVKEAEDEDDWRGPVVSSSSCSPISLSDDTETQVSKTRKQCRRSCFLTRRPSRESSKPTCAAEGMNEGSQDTPRPEVPTSELPVPERTSSQSQTPQPAPVLASNSSTPPLREQIRFYNRDTSYYSFCNIASYPVTHDGETYPTAEHLFHALKFLRSNGDIARRIRNTKDIGEVARLADRLHARVPKDYWNNMVDVMHDILLDKFLQHEDLQALLLSTGDAELVFDSVEDGYWGVDRDETGNNMLGRTLERVREELRRVRT